MKRSELSEKMITDTEKEHCRDILRLISSSDLFSLLETVTPVTIHAHNDAGRNTMMYKSVLCHILSCLSIM